jgi:type I restriction enzyme S subunit
MAKTGKSRVTPTLRFREFAGSGDWTTAELREVATILMDRVGESACVPYTVTAGEGLVSQQEKLGRTIAGRSIKNYTPLRKEDFAYNKSATKAYPQGFIARYVGDERAAVPNSIFTCFRVDTRVVYPAYLDYLFASNLHGRWLKKRVAIGARAHGSLNVSDDDLLDVPVPLPLGATSIDEQKKIASCLASIDDVIAAQADKVAALRAHKRGLMQKLFPREGNSGPRLRFPEFREAASWGKVSLGDVAEITLGKMLDEKKQKEGRLLSYINNMSLRWGHVDTSNLPQMYFADNELERYRLRAGDVLVCEGGEPGRAAVWDGRLPDMKFQKAVHRVRFTIPFEPKFLVAYLEAIAGTATFEALFTGGGIKHLTRETFSRLEIPSLSVAEQQRIAECLSSLDGQIAAKSEQLDALRSHKTGLMHQLFPSPNAD